MPPNLIELSTEAVLELAELKEGLRQDAPSFVVLCDAILSPQTQHSEVSQINMLADVRSYRLLRDAVGSKSSKARNMAEFRSIIASYLLDLTAGVNQRKAAKVDEAKQFSIALTQSMLSEKLEKIYERRDRTDMRHISNELIS